MKTMFAFLLLVSVVPNPAMGAPEDAPPKLSVEEMLKVEGSYEYNLTGRRLTQAIDPVMLKHLAEHPEEDSEADYILAVWILKAGVEKREEFRYLLENEALRNITRYESALLAYDYHVNGNQEALTKLLAGLRAEVTKKDGWGAGNWAGLGSLLGLSAVNEWKLTREVLGSVKLSADGSGGDERYGFWLKRRYFFPDDKEFPTDYHEFCREIGELQSSAAQSTKKPEDWRAGMPEEIGAKLHQDTANLLRQLSYDGRPKSQTGRNPGYVKVTGNNISNFDKDESNDWVIEVSSTNFQNEAISGTLVYDKTEHGWSLIAMLPGKSPIGWGEFIEGRHGICTREMVPEDSPSTVRESYFRWDGKRYIPDRVEFARGG